MKQTRQLTSPKAAVSAAVSATVSAMFSSGAAGIALALMLLTGAAQAQDNELVEDLEKRVEEQRIALEEAIANREETAERAKGIQEALEESEQRRLEVEEELKALCEEHESLQAGSYEECVTSIDT